MRKIRGKQNECMVCGTSLKMKLNTLERKPPRCLDDAGEWAPPEEEY